MVSRRSPQMPSAPEPTAARENQGRSAHVDVRLTDAQKAHMERVAKKLGLDVSTWLRMVGLRECGWDPEKESSRQ